MDISVETEGTSVHVDEWPNMTLSQLYKQKTILNDRLETAYRLQNRVIFNSLQQGIDNIEYFINIKHTAEDSNNNNNNKNIII